MLKHTVLTLLAFMMAIPVALRGNAPKTLPKEMTKEQIEEIHARLVEKKKSLAQELIGAEGAHKEAKTKFKMISDDYHDEIFDALLDSHDTKSHRSIPKEVIRALREVKSADKKIHSIRQKLQNLDKEVIETFGENKCLDVSRHARRPVKCTRVIVL